MPKLHPAGTEFTIGRAITLRDGADVTFIAIGEPVAEALLAAEKLQAAGLSARVISMHTLKPLDVAALLKAARETRAIITVEEHSIYGGLGSACAEVLAQQGGGIPFKIVGIPDEYTVSGSQTEIFKHYGISPEGLAATAQALLNGN
jgi:transketolase